MNEWSTSTMSFQNCESEPRHKFVLPGLQQQLHLYIHIQTLSSITTTPSIHQSRESSQNGDRLRLFPNRLLNLPQRLRRHSRLDNNLDLRLRLLQLLLRPLPTLPTSHLFQLVQVPTNLLLQLWMII